MTKQTNDSNISIVQRSKRKWILFILILLQCASANSIKDFKVTIDNKRVQLGDTGIVTIKVKTNGRDAQGKPSFPTTPSYRIVDRSNKLSFNNTTTIINGKMVKDTSYIGTYTYHLNFTDTGTITIPTITYTHKGDSIKSEPLSFIVRKEKFGLTVEESYTNSLLTSKQADFSKLLKCYATVERNRIQLGETTAVMLTVITKDKNDPIPLSAPKDSGFIILNMTKSQSYTTNSRSVNGKTIQEKIKQWTFLYNVTFTQEGIVMFPAISFFTGKDTLRSNPISFNVQADKYKPREIDTTIFAQFIPNNSNLYRGKSDTISLQLSWPAIQQLHIENDTVLDLADAVLQGLNTAITASIIPTRLRRFTTLVDGRKINSITINFLCTGKKAGKATVAPIPFGYTDLKEKKLPSVLHKFIKEKRHKVGKTPLLVVTVEE